MKISGIQTNIGPNWLNDYGWNPQWKKCIPIWKNEDEKIIDFKYIFMWIITFVSDSLGEMKDTMRQLYTQEDWTLNLWETLRFIYFEILHTLVPWHIWASVIIVKKKQNHKKIEIIEITAK